MCFGRDTGLEMWCAFPVVVDSRFWVRRAAAARPEPRTRPSQSLGIYRGCEVRKEPLLDPVGDQSMKAGAAVTTDYRKI